MQPYFESNSEKIRFNHGCTDHFPEHLHSQVEMLYLFRGETSMLVDGAVCPLSEGDLCICFPGVVHGYLGPGNSHALMLIFSPEISPDFSAIMTQTCPANPVLRCSELPDDVRFCMEQLRAESMSSGDERVLRAYIQVVLSRAIPRLRLQEQLPESTDIAHRILQYLSAHFAEPLSLSDLSRALGVSESHLSHTFSRRFHTHFRAYVNALRLDHACELLRGTDASITEILYECGFDSTRTFNRVFTLRYSVTPSAYRKRAMPG